MAPFLAARVQSLFKTETTQVARQGIECKSAHYRSKGKFLVITQSKMMMADFTYKNAQ